MSLDLIASLMSGCAAVLLFTLHSMTAKRHARWLDVPEYVRVGLAAFGLVLMVRSVNLLTLSGDPAATLGRINHEGVAATAALLYLIASVSWWVSRSIKEHVGVEAVSSKHAPSANPGSSALSASGRSGHRP
jgi:hypothetical protein